jgi:hypothetical protein
VGERALGGSAEKETPNTMKKSWIPKVLLAVAVLLGAAACSPQELRQWYTDHGIDHTQWTDAEIEAQAVEVTKYWDSVFALGKYNHVLSDEQLARLRHCESNGNYGAVGGGGTYRGAYQFSRSTWNSTAARHFPWLAGIDPVAASPAEQDAMTRALWSTSGRSPWPVCGQRV